MLLVVIPFISQEAPFVLKNLELMRKLDGRLKNPALIAYEQGTRLAYDIVESARSTFGEVSVFEYDRWTGQKEWPHGANYAFKTVASHISDKKNKLPWLWLESDAIPLCKGWLDVLYAAYAAAGKPLAGHVVGGMEHMNGCGIYPPDLREYSIRAFTSMKTPWDVAMKAETQPYTANLNHLILHYWNIHEGANYNGPLGAPLTVKSRAELERWITPTSVLLHRCKDGSVTEVLLKDEPNEPKKSQEAPVIVKVAKRRGRPPKSRPGVSAAQGGHDAGRMAAA